MGVKIHFCGVIVLKSVGCHDVERGRKWEWGGDRLNPFPDFVHDFHVGLRNKNVTP